MSLGAVNPSPWPLLARRPTARNDWDMAIEIPGGVAVLLWIAAFTSPFWVALDFLGHALHHQYTLRRLFWFVSCECVALTAAMWAWRLFPVAS